MTPPAETLVQRIERELRALGSLLSRHRIMGIAVILVLGVYGAYLFEDLP